MAVLALVHAEVVTVVAELSISQAICSKLPPSTHFLFKCVMKYGYTRNMSADGEGQ